MDVYVIIIKTLINTKKKFKYLKLIFIFFTFSNILYTSFLFYAFTSLVNYKIYYLYFFNVPFHLFEKKQYERLSNHFILQNKKTARKMYRNKNYILINHEIKLFSYQRKLCEVFSYSNIFHIHLCTSFSGETHTANITPRIAMFPRTLPKMIEKFTIVISKFLLLILFLFLSFIFYF